MKKVLLSLFFLLLCGCQSNTYTRYSSVIASLYTSTNQKVAPFDTQIELHAYTKNGQQLSANLDSLTDLFHNYHRLFDRHNDYRVNELPLNNIKTINDSYGSGNKVIVDRELINILKLSLALGELTEGYFNIGVGQASAMWQSFFDDIEETLPTTSHIDAAKACVPTIQQLKSILIINEQERSVIFNSLPTCASSITYNQVTFDRVSLTLGGIGKGYAVDRAKELILADNSASYHGMIISGGSSSLATLGKYKDEQHWPIEILDSLSSADTINAISLEENYSISTSGVYERGVIYEGQIYHHIINPFSARPENIHSSITISGRDGAMIDALSTALMSTTIEEGKQIIGALSNTNVDDIYQFGKLKAIYQTNTDFAKKTGDVVFVNLEKSEYKINNRSPFLSNHRFFHEDERINVKAYNPLLENLRKAIAPIGISLAVIVGGLVFGYFRKKNETKNKKS